MSIITYNGVSLEINRILRCERTAVWSEDRTTYLYTRWDIHVRAYYNPGATASAPGVLPAQSDPVLRNKLFQPRKKFKWTIGPHTVLESPATGFTVDANNGPKLLGPPSIIRVDGMKTFIVEAHFEICTTECDDSKTALLSNKFTETHRTDGQYYTTRIVTGRAYFRPDRLLKDAAAADQYRDVLLPKIPLRFKRESIEVEATPDGTQLAYTIVDRQKDMSLGVNSPAVEFKGYSTVSVGLNDTGSSLNAHNVRVKAVGQAGTHRFDLIKWALTIALAELESGGKAFIRQATIGKSMDEKEVDLDLTAMIFPSSQSVKAAAGDPALAINLDRIKNNDLPGILDQNQTLNPPPPYAAGTRGSWNSPILRQTLEDACKDPSEPFAFRTFDPKTGKQFMLGAPKIVVKISNKLPSDTTKYSQKSLSHVFTRYQMRVLVTRDENVLQIPVAGNNKPAVFIRMASSTSEKRVDWEAECIGDWPADLPKSVTGDANDVLLKREITSRTPYVLPDGVTLAFHVKGYYLFGQKVAKGADEDDMEVGALPTLTATPADTLLKAATFKTGLLGSGSAPTNVLKTTTLPTSPGSSGS